MSSSESVESKSAKKTRQRIVVSCTECNRRKQKCNREWPCNRCLSRRTAHLCQFEAGRPSQRVESLSPKRQRGQSEEIGEYKIETTASNPLDGRSEHTDRVLEYMNSSVLGTIFLEAPALLDSHAGEPSVLDPRRSRIEVLKLFPSRKTVDFLIQHFLAQVNWLYEEIYAQTFLERYNSWWSQQDYHGEEDVQFGVLILRICVNSLEFLPHPKWPTQGVLDVPCDVLESRCNAAACKLDSYQPRKSSLIRVQQLVLYITTLINAGNTKDSHAMLAETVKEAQEINLTLEEKWEPMSEFDKETRRKAFWNLYVWDRFYCTFLGRWPLIPEGYFNVKLPSETPYITSTDRDAPTIYTDVLINLELSRFMQSFLSAPTLRAERLNPNVVAAAAQMLKEKIVDTLHPAFRMKDPDTRWDSMIPTLKLKRAESHLIIYGVLEAMHKSFIGPLTLRAFQEIQFNLPDLRLAEAHRATLINCCINITVNLSQFLDLLGGGPHRYFMISMAAVEMTAVLGTCIISDNLIRRQTSRKSGSFPSLDPTLREQCIGSFEEGLKLLDLLAQRSPLALKGARIMRQLQFRILQEEKMDEQNSISSLPPTSTQVPYGIAPALSSLSLPAFRENLSAAETPSVVLDQDFMTAEWESFSARADMSWFFDDSMFQNGGVGDPGMDFGPGDVDGYDGI
ncbi:hypothetical protein N431DRAFT_388872 [Stipitochalara longipes BDJ]|nr:hypothetical protein N431DRAFT_388872 [Stipitochalara longipes BDJ]